MLFYHNRNSTWTRGKAGQLNLMFFFELDEAGRMVYNIFCCYKLMIPTSRSVTFYSSSSVLMAVCACQYVAEWSRYDILKNALIHMFIFLGTSY